MGMENQLVVEWKQVHMGNIVLENWVATLVRPIPSMEFAIICRQHDGWELELFPKGRIVASPRTYKASYAKLEKAQAHVERWARHHWQTIRPKRGTV